MTSIRAALDETNARLIRARLLPAMVQIAVESDDLGSAETAAQAPYYDGYTPQPQPTPPTPKRRRSVAVIDDRRTVEVDSELEACVISELSPPRGGRGVPGQLITIMVSNGSDYVPPPPSDDTTRRSAATGSERALFSR